MSHYINAGIGALTPDHNLTPTAPALSYCSSMTSLDEYGADYCQDITQKNLYQAAEVLREGNSGESLSTVSDYWNVELLYYIYT